MTVTSITPVTTDVPKGQKKFELTSATGKKAIITIFERDNNDHTDNNDGFSITGSITDFTPEEIANAIKGNANYKNDQQDVANATDIKINDSNFTIKAGQEYRFGSLVTPLDKIKSDETKYQTNPIPTIDTSKYYTIAQSGFSEGLVFGDSYIPSSTSPTVNLLFSQFQADLTAINNWGKGTKTTTSTPVFVEDTTTTNTSKDLGKNQGPENDGQHVESIKPEKNQEVPPSSAHKTDVSINTSKNLFEVKIDHLQHEIPEEKIDTKITITTTDGKKSNAFEIKKEINSKIDEYLAKRGKVSSEELENIEATIIRYKDMLTRQCSNRKFKDENLGTIKVNTGLEKFNPANFKDDYCKNKIGGRTIAEIRKQINDDIDEYLNPKTSEAKKIQLGCSITQNKNLLEEYKNKKTGATGKTSTEVSTNTSNNTMPLSTSSRAQKLRQIIEKQNSFITSQKTYYDELKKRQMNNQHLSLDSKCFIQDYEQKQEFKTKVEGYLKDLTNMENKLNNYNKQIKDCEAKIKAAKAKKNQTYDGSWQVAEENCRDYEQKIKECKKGIEAINKNLTMIDSLIHFNLDV